MADNHKETLFARRIARFVLFAAFAVLIIAGGLRVVEQSLAVPSLAPKLFKEKVELAWVKIEKPKKIEHVVDKSEFKIETPPEPPKKVEKPKPKPPVKKPIVKKEIPKKEEIVEDFSPAIKNEKGGEKDSAQNALQGNAEDLKNQSLALIIQTIEKNKHYPRRARQMGLEGRVILKITIQKGIIQSVDFQEKNKTEMLNQAAINAAEKLKGKSLPFKGDLVVNVPVEFSLKDF